MTLSSHLNLPYLEAAQAQKHVTHNEALRILDVLVQLAVLDKDLSAPPASPQDGQRWIVGPAPTGAWSGRAAHIAAWQDGAWRFSIPQAGWIAFVIDEATLYFWNGSVWASTQSAITALQNLALFGVGTTADATNPVAAKLNNALWTAKTLAEGGSGDLRYKLNKESAVNTLSLLFQTGYAGRAEIGLAGDDDFRFKVSADGSTWKEAIRIDRASGAVSCPSGLSGVRERLAANRTYYVRTDGSDSNNGLSNTPAGAFLTLQKAWDVVCALDMSIYTVTVQIADGTYSGVSATNAPVGTNPVVFQGNAANPGNVLINSVNGFVLHAPAQIRVRDLKLACSGTCLYTLHAGAYLQFGNLNFGASGDHIRANVGHIAALSGSTGNYTVSGGASRHVLAGGSSLVELASNTVTLTGAPHFSDAFFNVQGGASVTLWQVAWSGSATGVRYACSLNGILNSFGAGTASGWFPGSINGVCATGGQQV